MDIKNTRTDVLGTYTGTNLSGITLNTYNYITLGGYVKLYLYHRKDCSSGIGHNGIRTVASLGSLRHYTLAPGKGKFGLA
jgi:hypothetical protein